VFAGTLEGRPLVGFPKHWHKLVAGTPLAGITPHVLRHSYASVANDLGFTESTVAALLGHAQGTVTSRYIHSVDSALVMAADAVAGYIDALLEGMEFKRSCSRGRPRFPPRRDRESWWRRHEQCQVNGGRWRQGREK
jgi:hypothetical protein